MAQSGSPGSVVCSLGSADNGLQSYYCHVQFNPCIDYNNGVTGEGNAYHTFDALQTCEVRNQAFINDPTSLTFMGVPSTCIGGCEMVYGALTTVTHEGQSVTTVAGGREYSGAVCGAQTGATQAPPAPPPEKEECIVAGDGQTMCIRQDGQQCTSVSGTTQICWNPNDTGNKSHENVDQSRSRDGNVPPAPPPRPSEPPPEVKPSLTITETKTPGGGTVIVIIQNRNYGTGSAAPGGNTGVPKPPGAPGGGGGGGGGDDEHGNSTTGGGDCDTPPVSAGDPLLGGILLQAYKTRCAVEGKAPAGGTCSEPPALCSGSEVLCRTLQEDRAARCALEADQNAYIDSLNAAAGESDGLEGINESDVFGVGLQAGSLTPGMFGATSASQCSFMGNLEIMGREITLPSGFWLLAQMIGWLVAAASMIFVVGKLGE
jgi:hypothetical protein